MFIDIIKVFIS